MAGGTETAALERGSGGLGALAVEVGHIDVGALLGEQRRRRKADARACASDDRDVVLKPAHDALVLPLPEL